MTDHYLSKTPVHREMLQLVGSTAMLIASKFEVRMHGLQLQVHHDSAVGGTKEGDEHSFTFNFDVHAGAQSAVC